jgi:hypothetical protein
VTDQPAPYWPAVRDRARAAIGALPADHQVVLVPHSNAGLFVPVIADGCPRPVRACVFVDAALPPPDGEAEIAPPAFAEFLRALPRDAAGRLPPWSRWWDDDEVAAMLPDPVLRAEYQAGEPRLPADYFDQRIPVPPGWDAVHSSFLLFGPPYDEQAREAEVRGWHRATTPGAHLHQLVDPAAVAAAIAEAARAGG